MASALAVPTPARLAALARLRCAIFQTAYNPTSVRTGAKYLRRRLQGPSMTQYYPERVSITKLNRGLPDELRLIDTQETQRVQKVEEDKRRGKGTPRKARSKEESRRAGRKR